MNNKNKLVKNCLSTETIHFNSKQIKDGANKINTGHLLRVKSACVKGLHTNNNKVPVCKNSLKILFCKFVELVRTNHSLEQRILELETKQTYLLSQLKKLSD